MNEPVVIRPFATTEEYQACVVLQEETWGEGFSERVSPAILKVAQILGGVSAGAYDTAGRLIGFVFGMTGLRGGEVVHWSDMLAVRPEARDSGLGRLLKEYQRDELLARGVEKMFWTFDPLRSRNAHLNITKLGAVVREYVKNMYGDTDSPLHRGIGTDRCVALWLLASERVRHRLAHGGARPLLDQDSPALGTDLAGPETAPFALDAESVGPHPRPLEPVLSLEEERVRIAIPADIGALLSEDLGLAIAWREATRAALGHYISSGLEVREFYRGEKISTYLLARGTVDA